MHLVVGLGNPGPKYAHNRHNIGFLALDEIAARHGFGPWRGKFQGEAADGNVAGHKVLGLKPLTYMNNSGQAVGEAARFYKLEPGRVIVIYDEIDLALGRIRVKTGGGHGGHNGVRDIIAHLGPDFVRVRLGVGHPGRKELVHGHVLSDFGKSEWPAMQTLIDAVAAELPTLLGEDASAFMSRVSQTMLPPKPKPSPKEQ
jgi:PTH1 family peptidyl-tRNA hydrolase